MILTLLKAYLKTMKHKKGGNYLLFLILNKYRKIPFLFFDVTKKSKETNNYFSPSEVVSYAVGMRLDTSKSTEEIPIPDHLLKYLSEADILTSIAKNLCSSDIMMCDHETIKQVNKRLRKVNELIEISSNEILQTEKNALIKYLAECVAKTGKRRAFNDEYTQYRKTVLKSINRFLRELSEIDNELAKYLKQNLIKTRYEITYKGENDG